MNNSDDTLDEQTAEQVAELFRSLSDVSRVRLIFVLAHEEMNVNALAQRVGLSKSAVSHHLRGLRQMRLVRWHKVGRQVFYALSDEHIAELFSRRLDHVRFG